ncbi:MAG: hypothetical protein QOJ71_778, partial [Actinomycetota bacterium]|nr:hypothetical protein [Actinomycetota bacterium]
FGRGSYYVGLDGRQEVTIFQGRPGGLLWVKPTVARRTKLALDDLPADTHTALRDGKTEPSKAAAEAYVRRLQRTTTTTSTTQPAAPPKTTDQLKVLVLNGGAPTGDAAKLRTKLVQAGYTNEPQANTWSGHRQTGLTLMCKPGLDREKVALSQQTALQGVRVVDFPTPPPPNSDSVDCVVVVGS